MATMTGVPPVIGPRHDSVVPPGRRHAVAYPVRWIEGLVIGGRDPRRTTTRRHGHAC